MAEVVKMVQGNAGSTDYSLDLDDATDFEAKRIYLDIPPDNELWHHPDFGESSLVREQASDRPCTLDLRVLGTADAITGTTAEDDVQNSVVALRRWLKNAQKAGMEDSIYPVYLQLQKDNATNAVKHRIKSGYIDDSLSHYIPYRHQGKVQALHVTVKLVLAPYGEWTSTLTLQNDMFSSPHFVEDSNSDGLADGWAAIAGETLTIATENWLIGGQAQRIETDNTAEIQGIRAENVSSSISSRVNAYIWIAAADAGDDTITIQLRDGGGVVLDTGTFDPSSPTGYDKSITSPSGGTKTWYRYAVSDNGQGPRANVNIQLRVVRLLADASAASSLIYVDGAYVEVNGSNQTFAPDAWMSAGNIDNRGDIQSSSQATENYLNYWDIWGVPGDAPALVKTKFDWTTTAANANLMYVGKIADGDLLAADEIYWIEDDAFSESAFANMTGSQPGDGARTAGEYRRMTDDGAGDGTGFFTINLSGDSCLSLTHNPKRVVALLRTSNVSTDFYSFITAASQNVLLWESGSGSSTTINLDNANQWTYLDLGTIVLRDYWPLGAADYTQYINFFIKFSINTPNATADLDAVLLLPTEENIHITTPQLIDFNPNTIDTYIDGRYQFAINSDLAVAMPRQGTLWTVEPGNIMSRYIWAVQEWDTANKDLEGNHAPTLAAAIELTIWPRTRHLLGTE